MYPATEWLIIAFAGLVLAAYAGRKIFLSRKVPGDAFFWSVVFPVCVFFAILSWAGRHNNISDQFIQSVNTFFDWAARKLGLGFARIFVAVLTVIIGICAYAFKSRNQRCYGGVEIVVGFLTAYIVAGTLAPGNLELAKWATLSGAAYVIARGIGNYRDGKRRLNPPSVNCSSQ
jgi:hypothetical protein